LFWLTAVVDKRRKKPRIKKMISFLFIGFHLH
jgi:hypothetical protein